MKKHSPLLVFSSLIFFCCGSYAQKISDAVLQQRWNAQWITAPGSSNVNQWNASADEGLKAYGIYKFRKSFELPAKPASFVVHVSGDNRYKLYVN